MKSIERHFQSNIVYWFLTNPSRDVSGINDAKGVWCTWTHSRARSQAADLSHRTKKREKSYPARPNASLP